MRDKIVDRDKILTVLHEEFVVGRGVWLTVTGSSMEPLLRHLRDKVILVPPEKYVPETGDIVLFRRKGGACVLHRIIGRTPNGGYIVNGDAQTWVENIGSDQILAIAAALVRKGHYIQTGNKIYRLYVFCWGLTRPARGIIFRSAGRIKRCVNKVRTLKKGKNTDD
ncbi:MAG TPA: S24/S26 family peptidase [Candidatus Mediterraneibacter intestinigallinarum]|nr:S24/S26 family peptidase [Candidatus Mediterraneibacter intestinigallinarum]